ncbi:acetyl/propionyl/methylcrotonyl-CoA carboxylase subunit alpha [Ralstonia holmesii]|uniref:Acetyl-/propionyl-coenzyme A carboxylase alpha chain n=1 Tax=Ralstonia holmesii TaxID=3058602 RepID=A0ABC8QFQ5_9RALS|nr:biotin carboxylase N-terminal domain-containing protein [Ralstonia sp. LMG 32967]CAJ0791145.1 Acetyl-/propionyl-coenzyme A carboxylase alpha chain [Ralstonia sp. LMG 32967]CAJ0816807.1 Acetyl-/propionyl-coenzyme A carboxylase alpha chain [Ralstonia sp. LMG 32967]
MTAPHAAFRSILIANRGEIALRIMRTARRLGMRTIAVYSEADRDAPHCRAADLALPIGASQPQASYLNIAALLEAARKSGTQAIHPGYGFLAESDAFARACADAGLVFIGPPADAIRAMGNKAGAKRLMEAAGVPCVPGYQGEDQSAARMAHEAARIGYPVMIKAAAGGGGRGMRRVDRAEDFAAALQSARSEAENAFASCELILEKAIVEPRHIEIQVFADTHGNVVHLGERDCSVQRRHQKVIEESPSPAVSPELRARMGAVSVAAARAIGYVGAGTLEFLLAPDGAFYFMEMNTRLQVEHAVTEAVIGVDLVEWQLRVALGEPLPLAQDVIDARRAQGGHAVEVRLCAEDPQQDFLPQSGTVARWRAPQDVRTDHALADGLVVSQYYDSMLAKIVAHGTDRADACRRLAHALDDCLLLGLPTNRAFLRDCVAHPAFLAGDVSTAFIARHFPAAMRHAAVPDAAVCQAAAVLLTHLRQETARRYPAELHGWASSCTYPTLCRFTLDDQAIEMRVRALGARRWELTWDGGATQVALVSAANDRVTLALGDTLHAVDYAFTGDACHIVLNGVEHTAVDTTYARAERDGVQAGSGRISAPMNGRVVAVHVAEGEAVCAGQVLLVVEAMKMEHSIAAPLAGEVKGLFTQVGAQVAPGGLLMEIAAA